MSSRPPSPPPQLPGYEHEQLLGSGGFADVFLYQQFRPRRQVAIKVLLATALEESVRRQFDVEANVMAQLSTHPSIVTIHQAEVSGDHRPYLVMEYCPRPNYGIRFRRERITVAEALRVGVQIAGAVETAHRAGILHRDIKPANILVTDYNRPALTDFGISIAAGQAHEVDDSQGLSIPWSPPEFFADPPRADVRSDVFSLAATVYSLLAGRTPFEVPGRRSTAADLVHRIESEPLRPLNRPDVPPALNRVLSIAMAKDPASRYDTALALGRGLQQVEQALSLPVTQMDVLDERGPDPAHDDDELEMHTRIRKVATVDPDAGSSTAGRRRPPDRYAGIAPALVPHAAPRPVSRGPATQPSQGATVLRPAGAPAPADDSSAPPPGAAGSGEGEDERPRAMWPYVALATVVVIALGVGTTLGVRYFLVEEEPELETTDLNVVQTPVEPPGEPTGVSVEITVPEAPGGVRGRAQISWEYPTGYSEGDFFEVRWKDMPEEYQEYGTSTPVMGRNSTVRFVPPGLTGRCVEVRTVTTSGVASMWVQDCLDGD
ncbi:MULTISPECIES: protein kinase domain-containing protein [unclassified Brachybacterium]|uniref:protein kinase domain-containing protein n=1 Tax=unclassified Brachybacterium TaxID=2623841 RepID=UPI0040339E34